MKRIDVASALIFNNTQDQILLVRNKKGNSSYWSLPGGAVELGETLEEALRREAKEQTGLTVEMSGLYSVREVFFSDSDQHALIFTFMADIIGGEIEIDDPDQDILEVKWTELKAANELMPYLPEKLKAPSEKIQLPAYFLQGTV